MCDNLGTVNIISKGRSKDPFIMKLMRTLVMCAAENNFAIYSKHVAGVHNNIADSLSRLQMKRFRALAPQAEQTGTPCPPANKVIWTTRVTPYGTLL